ncbi:phosphate signaling complex protein PhoU [Salipaludibacillus sp. HK11]|uniref:phosphate signaling complex protein PhoU n=1 Tax=Salipaludibacillus sp. HK11 TaxID=3394320 RepID=UPI0039FDBCB8
MMREGFLIELAELKQEIMLLGEMVGKAFEEVLHGMEHEDYAKFDSVIAHDKAVNDLELEINEKATLLIAKQQPVASDLRKIIVALKISSDLERVGDLAVDMSKAAKRLESSEHLQNHQPNLMEMATKTKIMLKEVLKAYNQSNVLEAQHIANTDDEVDEAYGNFVKSIFNVVVKEQETSEWVIQMAYISRYIERIADYCTNIAEWIIYEVNGQRFDLN